MGKSCTETPLEEVVVHTLTLVVLQIGKRCSLNSDVETPASVRAERYPYKRHLPTVQVTSDGYGCGSQLSVLYIKTAGKCNTRLWCEVYATVEAEGLVYIPLKARRAVVCILDIVADDIVKSDIPRYREVIVSLCHILSSQYRVHKSIRVGEWVEVLRRYAVDIVYC